MLVVFKKIEDFSFKQISPDLYRQTAKLGTTKSSQDTDLHAVCYNVLLGGADPEIQTHLPCPRLPSIEAE